MVTRGDGCLSRGQPSCSHPKRLGLRVSRLFGTPYMMRAHGMKNGNQILHGDRTTGKIFTGSTTPTALARNFCDTNADARSVCGSGPSCSFDENKTWVLMRIVIGGGVCTCQCSACSKTQTERDRQTGRQSNLSNASNTIHVLFTLHAS